jgi:hypothetical protein
MTHETEMSSKFVDETIREYGSRIWIQKQQDPLRRGTPDIYSMIDGMFIPIECKRAIQSNGKSILPHKFEKIQIKRLRDLLEVYAYPIGLIFCEGEKRYILPLDIREDGNISMEEYLKLPVFNWMEIRDAATEAYINRHKK